MALQSSAHARRSRAAQRKPAASRKPTAARTPASGPRLRRTQAAADELAVDVTAAGRRIPLRLVGLAVLLIVLLSMFLPSISTGIAQYQQISALERDIEVTQQEVDALKERQKDLQDPEYIAQRAREDYHYVKDGEKLYIVIDDSGHPVQAQGKGTSRKEERTVRAQPWYIELVDSLRAVGFATQESP